MIYWCAYDITKHTGGFIICNVADKMLTSFQKIEEKKMKLLKMTICNCWLEKTMPTKVLTKKIYFKFSQNKKWGKICFE
jgi:hypothetical protein